MDIRASTSGQINPRHTSKFSISIAVACLFLGTTAHAQTQNPAQSVLQQKPGPDYSHLTEVPNDQKKNLADRCSEMLQEVEALKGKPQRRSTAMARYRAECERP